VNVILFGNRAFSDIVIMRSCWIRMGPKFNKQGPYKKMETSLCFHRDKEMKKHREKSLLYKHGGKKIGIMFLQTKEYQRFLETTRN
jgi:hypothetical protein